jgi:hypothetical protein
VFPHGLLDFCNTPVRGSGAGLSIFLRLGGSPQSSGINNIGD